MNSSASRPIMLPGLSLSFPNEYAPVIPFRIQLYVQLVSPVSVLRLPLLRYLVVLFDVVLVVLLAMGTTNNKKENAVLLIPKVLLFLAMPLINISSPKKY